MGERAELAQCGEQLSVAMHHGQCDEEGREAVPRALAPGCARSRGAVERLGASPG